MIAFLLSTLLRAEPTDQQILDTLTKFNTKSYTKIPVLNEQQRKNLLKGDVVKLVNKGKNEKGEVESGKAMAYYISDLPKSQLWVAFQDPQFQVQKNTYEVLFNRISNDNLEWYGYMDLSWPLTDRHWLVRVWNNHEMAKSTNNKMWEHPWILIKDGVKIARPLVEQGKVKKVSVEDYDKAIYLPDCQGVWAMMDIGDKTLMVYSATAAVGGSLPEGLMMQLLLSGLNDFMLDGVKRAEQQVPKRYTSGSPPIYGGDGVAIPTF